MPARNLGQRRRTLLFLGISLLLHLSFFLLVPEPAPEIRTVHRFQVRPWSAFDRLRPFMANRPDAPASHLERLGAPDFSAFPEIVDLLDMPYYAELPGVPLPRLVAPDPIELATRKPEFQIPAVVMPDLDKMALDAVRELADEYEQYARFYLPDADITDSDSKGRLQARKIVERAIQAMGGRDALLAVRELRARVWIQSSQHSVPGLGVVNVPPYVYPVADWHASGLDRFTSRPIQVKLSLDLDRPNADYALRNPPERWTYSALFGRRWSSTFRPAGRCSAYGRPRIAKLRETGESARWHFIDRFLGDGVVLDYVEAEKFGGESVETIRVDDRRYGLYFEAFFSRQTGLLLALREGLTPEEEMWYQRLPLKCRGQGDLPPVWTTVFHRYREVDGVLTPHLLERWKNDNTPIIAHINPAFNGDQPDESPPILWEGGRTFAPLVH